MTKDTIAGEMVRTTGLSPRRAHWCRLLQGLVLELAKDGFQDTPANVFAAMLTLMEYAGKDIKRYEAAEEQERQRWEGLIIPPELLPGVLGLDAALEPRT
jgi:hypothetical protein